MALRLMQDKVAIQRSAAVNKTAGGIMLSAAPPAPNEGTVVAVGPGKQLENGTVVPLTVKVGDLVMFVAHAANSPIQVDGVELLVMPETDVIAILEDEA